MMDTANRNLVLIGMPGCGKTTLARAVSALTGRRVLDSDELAEKEVGMSVRAFFIREGETAFRDLESRILRQLGSREGVIIATGGGCILRQENYAPLHENGLIVWLQRDIDRLPREGRPLSLGSDLHAMFRQREPLYRAFADCTVDNNRTVAEAAAELAALITAADQM